jgi:hypothetical protein
VAILRSGLETSKIGHLSLGVTLVSYLISLVVMACNGVSERAL